MKQTFTVFLFATFASITDAQLWQEHVLSHSSNLVETYGVDIDDDGDSDLVTGLCWRENLGGGTMANGAMISSHLFNVSASNLADMDSDGDVDVLAVSENENTVAWFENLGNGKFAPQHEISDEAMGAADVVADDLDNDGDIDVIVCCQFDDRVVWYENYGLQNFGFKQTITWTTNEPVEALIVDFNNDGNRDVLTLALTDNELSWFAGNGTGGFGAQQIISTTSDTPYDMDVADVDGDGDPDVLTASYSDDDLAWYANDGNGNFGAEILITGTLEGARVVHAADFDNDGDIDVLATGPNGTEYWFENTGGGNFASAIDIIKAGNTADMDGDGDREILTGNGWYAFNGNGFSTTLVGSTFYSGNLYQAVSADVNGDNFKDIIAGGDDKLLLYLNDGFDVFNTSIELSGSLDSDVFVATADVEPDGDVDIVTCDNSDVNVFLNDGGGTFDAPYSISSGVVNGNNLLLEDLDNDLDPEVCYYKQGNDQLILHENLGAGNFSSAVILLNSGVNTILQARTADIEGDGDMDIYFHGYAGIMNDVHWLENPGDGNFSADQVLLGAASVGEVLLNDLDEDGDCDMLFQYGYLGSYENTGGASFQNFVMLDSETYDLHAAGDVDGDGDTDVLYNHTEILDQWNSTTEFLWKENNGDGTFTNSFPVTHNTYNSSTGSIVDVDGDSDLDYLFTDNSQIASAQWLENTVNNGCTDPAACNYKPENYIDDGTCCYGVCGCIDPTSMNYNSAAECDNLNCLYAGCTDVASCNYDEDANFDDGSCDYSAACTDTEAMNYDPDAACDDGSCLYPGCTDPFFCNFDPNANFDDGSCITIYGCTDPVASNFDPGSNCDDQSCNYRLEGKVFFDTNENGIKNSGEPGLAFQTVTIQPGNITAITNDNGDFLFTSANVGSYELFGTVTANYPFITTENPLTFTISNGGPSEVLNVGLSDEQHVCAVCVDLYPAGTGYPCDVLVNHNICCRNMGNVTISGVVEIEYDPLFQGYEQVTPIDSVVGNHIYMTITDIAPGEMFFYDVKLHSPTVDFIGEFLTSTCNVYGYYQGNLAAFGTRTRTFEMTCAYDPNDKQVFPNGYAEPHYVLDGTELEYLVRFQNTGNASATDVVVSDTLEADLDLSTFHLMANSHSVMTTLYPETREVKFYFENIMLPDSGSNEPGSHGLISYIIHPYTGLAPETEINNTAYIYFDNNPAIVTNTTWTTIFDCEGLAHFTLEDAEICEGTEFVGTSVQPYIEMYAWQVDGLSAGNNSTLVETAMEDMNTIALTVQNPLCTESYSVDVNVLPAPDISVGPDVIVCLNDEVTLVATGSNDITWSGGLGDGAEQTLTATSTATYTATGSNEFGCIASDEVTVSVSDYPLVSISQNGQLLTATEATTWQWYFGTTTENMNPIDDADEDNFMVTTTGYYSVVVTNEAGCSTLSDPLFVDVIGVEENSGQVITLFPNPLHNLALLHFGEMCNDCNVLLFDEKGSLVRDFGTITSDQLLIERGNLAVGNYSIRVIAEENIRVIKIVVD